ncbi:MAG: hypothetical protein HZB50_06465 [Chloroflexi bacterium]|nr:hypothetical protein [Chloroflexota bacterium]
MQAINAIRTMNLMNSKKVIPILFVLVILATIGMYANNVYKAFYPIESLPKQTITTISQETLEQTYGLRVNLVAVTAAGGLVDVRLKIIDGEKAKTLLSDPQNFPSLMTDNGVILRTSEEIAKQGIKIENDGNLFLMFPNSQNLIKPGTQVTILFGNTALEAIPSK